MLAFTHKPTVIEVVIVLATGLGLTVFYLRNAIRSRHYMRVCKMWPAAKGRITSRPRITEFLGHNSDRMTYGLNRNSVHLTYEYVVNNETYDGDTISFNLSIANSPSAIERIADGYSLNDIVDVYYDPKHPEISVLVR